MNVGHVEGYEPHINRLGGQLTIGFLEPMPDLTKARCTVLIVNAVIGDSVDEEERKYLDALALESALLLEMLLDGLILLSPCCSKAASSARTPDTVA
jgi:hypothetical protein